jgi:hypothetical protein
MMVHFMFLLNILFFTCCEVRSNREAPSLSDSAQRCSHTSKKESRRFASEADNAAFPRDGAREDQAAAGY